MNDFEIKGVNIRLNKKLSPTKIKEKGFINGFGVKIVTEVEVGEEVYNKLKELENG